MMDGGQHLQKVHHLPVRKWTDILRIQEKSTKTANITRCLQDFEKPRLFWLMNTFTRSRLAKIKVINLFLLSREVLPQGQRAIKLYVMFKVFHIQLLISVGERKLH